MIGVPPLGLPYNNTEVGGIAHTGVSAPGGSGRYGRKRSCPPFQMAAIRRSSVGANANELVCSTMKSDVSVITTLLLGRRPAIFGA